MNSEAIAILLLAGDSSRFKYEKSKIFYPINGKPLFVFPLLKLSQNSSIKHIVIACKEEHKNEIASLCSSFKISKDISYVIGGNTRSESVKNAISSLENVSADTPVLVCDGDRPNLTEKLINENINATLTADGCVTAVKTIDTIFEIDSHIKYLDRSKLMNAQTPQTFKFSVISDVYSKLRENSNTDDASICIKEGYNISVVEGSYNNYKITTIDDIKRFISENENE